MKHLTINEVIIMRQIWGSNANSRAIALDGKANETRFMHSISFCTLRACPCKPGTC